MEDAQVSASVPRVARTVRVVAAAVAAFLLLSAPAHAHLVQSGFGEFYDGIVHLLVTPADLLMVLALGLLAGQCGKPAARRAMLALPAGWLVGSLAAAILAPSRELPLATTVSFATLGMLVAANPTLAASLVGALGVAVGALHGFASGGTSAAGGLGLAGATLAIFVLVTLIAALAASRSALWQRVVLRVAGSWIAAIGLLMLGWILRSRA